MNRIILSIFTLLMLLPACAQAQTLTLDSCRARALRANKQMGIARAKRKAAEATRKSVRTKYLPHIDAMGGYLYSSREISILNDEQKAILGHLGTLGGSLLGAGSGLSAIGDAVGDKVVDAFHTNTHHIFAASAMVTQPIFMGGAITAANRMARIAEKMAGTNIEAKKHDVAFAVENAYWTVVSLRQKQRLAEAYLGLVRKLGSDVHKMIENGVATRADGLKVDVAVNEAEMTKTKVDNGLVLARMLLCEQCGMPLDSEITLADEAPDATIAATAAIERGKEGAALRPELRLLEDAVALSRQQTKLARAGYLPQVMLMGGTVFSNPSVYNGFERKFKGGVNVGVLLRMPVFDWGETMYKVRAAKCATNIAQLQYDEAAEMIDLQVSQCTFRVREANKNLATARKNIQSAEENLRCANIGFKEGVMQTTDVMAAQTAWLQAQTQRVDAEIDVKMSETALRKAVGEMGETGN